MEAVLLWGSFTVCLYTCSLCLFRWSLCSTVVLTHFLFSKLCWLDGYISFSVQKNSEQIWENIISELSQCWCFQTLYTKKSKNKKQKNDLQLCPVVQDYINSTEITRMAVSLNNNKPTVGSTCQSVPVAIVIKLHIYTPKITRTVFMLHIKILELLMSNCYWALFSTVGIKLKDFASRTFISFFYFNIYDERFVGV